MVVQQGRLSSTDTTKDMESFYFDTVASGISSVDRIIHNGTQFARLVLRRPKPTTAYTGTTSRVTAAHLADGLFTPNPTSGVNTVTVGFGSKLVATRTIRLFSTSSISTTLAGWGVRTSLTNIESEFNNSSFIASISSVGEAIVSTDAGLQFRYTLTVGTPSIDSSGGGLPYWRITHTGTSSFDNLTEVQIVPPLDPTISYFDTDGSFSSSSAFEQPNILDACWDVPNNRFYTIRFNDATVGTSTVSLNDNFGESDSGTASGTNNFNPARWTESNSNTQFLRTSDKLSYNVSSGKGQLETTFSLANNIDIQLDATPTTLTSKQMWLALRGLDADNKTLMSEGVGYDNVTTSGVWFATHLANFTNSTSSSELRELRPLWHNTASGTDSFTIAFTGGTTWTVSGTQTGALSSATTGVTYNETVAPTTPIEFLISSTSTPSPGEQFTFDLFTDNIKKAVTTTGIIGIKRTGTDFTTKQVITSPRTVSTSPVSIELFGNTNGTVNIQADNFQVVTGSGSFPDVAVFTIEKTNSVGTVQNPPLISAFDVIGDPSLSYNDFLDGRVQLACTSSGSGGGFIYVKVDNQLYSYANNISLGTEDGSNAVSSSIAEIAKDGISSFSWTKRSGTTGTPFLTYLEYDEILNIVHLKTIDKDTLQDTTTTKEVLLNISDYNTNRYKVFFDQNDFDTLYYVDSGRNLRSWNIDDRISAFMAVNAEDVTLPAGTAQQTDVNADVINAWGEALSGKTVTFSVTSGDGAVSPSSDTTDGAGRASTQFTVGSTVGVSTVTATVTES